MLQTLKIKNVALIDSASLNFGARLNVISGETGAGKSILLDSLTFVFGGRADRTLIRENEDSMQVEAIFTGLNAAQQNFVKTELNIDCSDELFLFRSLDQSGRNVCKINGELVPVAMVKRVCNMLVDLHGQSEHLSILNNDYQLYIVDLFSPAAQKELNNLHSAIQNIKAIDDDLSLLGGSPAEKQNLIDLYTYQLNEINDANIGVDELDSLQTGKQTMQQFERINEALSGAYEVGAKSGYQPSASEQLSAAEKFLSNIAGVNEEYNQLFSRLNSARLEVEDIMSTVYEKLSTNQFNEERFNFVDNRIDQIKTLFRKYGGSFENLQQYKTDISTKLDNLINGQARFEKLMDDRQAALEKINQIQTRLTDCRKKSAQQLASKMQQELKTLGMPNACMSVEFDRVPEEFTEHGADRVEFMFTSNLGFNLKPLNKVVSGGEMSRVMLAYKIVVSAVDQIGTILFDEIDSGLSGHIASVVAEYMARLSQNKQIIAISHLPQICAMADNNIKVEKYSDRTTTHTKTTELVNDDLLKEIARLMGTTDASGLSAAAELKTKSNQFKAGL